MLLFRTTRFPGECSGSDSGGGGEGGGCCQGGEWVVYLTKMPKKNTSREVWNGHRIFG